MTGLWVSTERDFSCGGKGIAVLNNILEMRVCHSAEISMLTVVRHFGCK